jgi:hypothetical protein
VLPEVGPSDLEEARKLAEEGKYEEALQKHIWFHEESKKSPSLGGVRLSYALSSWIKLSEKYPPAKKALVDIRDKNDRALLDGTGNFRNFHDLSAINRHLKEEDKTYETFKALHDKYPKLAKRCYRVARDLLVDKKEYQICGQYIIDPILAYERIRYSRELNLSMMRTKPKRNTPGMRQYTDDSFIKSTCQLIEILMGLGKKAEAEEIQKRALRYFDHDKIRDAIKDSEQKIEK